MRTVLKGCPGDRAAHAEGHHRPGALLREIEVVETIGYRLLDEELESGLRPLALPIRGANGLVVSALNVSAQVERTPEVELRQLLLPALLDAAAMLGPAVSG